MKPLQGSKFKAMRERIMGLTKNNSIDGQQECVGSTYFQNIYFYIYIYITCQGQTMLQRTDLLEGRKILMKIQVTGTEVNGYWCT